MYEDLEMKLSDPERKELLNISVTCKKRLSELNVKEKHNRIGYCVFISHLIVISILIVIAVPTTAYSMTKISQALEEKIKDADLTTQEISELNKSVDESEFSEEDIEELMELKRNESGQTYGPEALGADLIAVTSDEGIDGYVYREEVYLNMDFKTPEEALEWQENRSKERVITVYDSDGSTEIGTFTIRSK